MIIEEKQEAKVEEKEATLMYDNISYNFSVLAS